MRRPAGAAIANGYGLVELLVGLAIAAGALLVTVPQAVQFLAVYHRNAAARDLLAQVRRAQSEAVSRGGVFGIQWGASVGRSATEYRIVRDTTGSCAFPAVGAAVDGTNVLVGWTDVAAKYPGLTIQSIRDNASHSLGGVMFNSRGASTNTCTAVSHPTRITLADEQGGTRAIEIGSAGTVRLP